MVVFLKENQWYKKIFDIIIGLVILVVVHIGPYVLGIVIFIT